ncbi:MAG: DASS family sodium-coupled anion symporter [Vicinamibacterales bacterium]
MRHARRGHQVTEAVEAFSPAEEQFNRRRRTTGLIVGPLAFALVFLLPMNVSPPAHKLAAIIVLMIVFWMTEALPLAVTALMGPVMAVLFGITSARVAFAPFADPIIFLFIGSFILAEAMFVHGLERRLAFTALASRWVGHSGLRLGIVYALVACVVSMWMSNTATTAMLFPLGMALLAELGRERKYDRAFQQYALAMMLMTAFAASIGGIGTPVGTPPNLIGIGLLRDLAGINVSFVSWMMLGVPIVAITMAVLIAVLLYPRARHIQLSAEAVASVRAELARLGPMSAGERNVVIAFGLTTALWIVPGTCQAVFGATNPTVQHLTALLPESVAAMVGALLLFVLPVHWNSRRFTLTWEEAASIDWGIVLLFGGGLAIGQLAESTGLSTGFGHWVAAEFPAAGAVGLTLIFTAVAIVMSEATSNTAAANIIVPLAIAVAKAAGVSPLEPGLGATLGASMGFMMPISTPPNAIVYSSGHVPIGAMMRHGIVLDLVGYVIIVVVVITFGSWLR